jgi:hypothetical protein
LLLFTPGLSSELYPKESIEAINNAMHAKDVLFNVLDKFELGKLKKVVNLPIIYRTPQMYVECVDT